VKAKSQFSKLYGLAIVAVLSLGIALRFWQLARFNTLVFDEVYFAEFARAYLAGKPKFDAHPPMGKYLIAVGIWLSGYIPWNEWGVSINPQLGLPAFSYRWMNALVGGLIPLVAMGVAHTLSDSMGGSSLKQNKLRGTGLTQQQTFTLLTGIFVAVDGLFIVESRYALINIYVVFFGLLGHWLWLWSGQQFDKREFLKARTVRVLAGVSLGASIGTKWNGLGYLLGVLIWEMVRAGRSKQDTLVVWQLMRGGVYGLLIPGLTYGLTWWPHLALTHENLAILHTSLFTFHQELGTGGHIACSPWYTWPLLVKPFPYWYQAVRDTVFTVSNLGNPVLWWLSSAAMVLLVMEAIRYSVGQLVVGNNIRLGRFAPLSLYLLIGYLCNWLPWMLVNRCTYLYLYMPAAIFAFMTFARVLSEWLHSSSRAVKIMGWIMMGAITLAFFFWLPLAIGSPLPPEALRMRWWLRSWI